MASIIQCEFCRYPFNSFGTKICPNCLSALDDDIIKIKDYVLEHPEALNILALSEATGVSKKVILYLLESGRLEVANIVTGASCASCGAEISTGNYCEECSHTLRTSFGSFTAESEPVEEKNSNLMRKLRGGS